LNKQQAALAKGEAVVRLRQKSSLLKVEDSIALVIDGDFFYPGKALPSIATSFTRNHGVAEFLRAKYSFLPENCVQQLAAEYLARK
jgi:hypothetical protein